MEEESPTNGNKHPKQKPTHLPGASTHHNKYPKSGSEEEFWKRCEEATRLRARKMKLVDIGTKLDVDTSMVHLMIRRYLRGAARFYPAVELREILAEGYRELFRLTMEELDRIDDDDKFVTDKRLACIARGESLITKEAQIYGIVGVGGEINLYQSLGNDNGSAGPQLTQEVAAKVRGMIRETRKVMDAEDAKFTVTDESKDKGNGDQGKGEICE